jgi:hypothetical protein
MRKLESEPGAPGDQSSSLLAKVAEARAALHTVTVLYYQHVAGDVEGSRNGEGIQATEMMWVDHL